MVKRSEQVLDETFAALADPTRRKILVALGEGDRSVSEIAAPFKISLPAISKHLSVLERAGLITREREGRVRRCHLEREPLSDALEWIANYGRFWEESFDSLERLLAQQSKQSKRGR
jgi:DNA-binding transcriptional ArsR family regulator